VYNGPALPVVSGSMGNTVSYKRLSITARITYKLGHYMRRESVNYFNFYNYGQGHSDFSRRWQKPGDEAYTYVPAMDYPTVSTRQTFYSGSEVLVIKADNVRLQYINASYRLSRTDWKRLPFKQAELYCVVNNIGVLWKANSEGIDPEYQYGLSPARTISFGLKTQF
jgi:hypothetical protein